MFLIYFFISLVNLSKFIFKMLFYGIIAFVMCVITYLICSKIALAGVVGFIVKGIVVFAIANILFLATTFFLSEFNETKRLMGRILKKKF